MGGRLRAYDEEDDRHADFLHATCTAGEAMEGIRHLCEWKGLPVIPVQFRATKGVRSVYRPGDPNGKTERSRQERIEIDITMMNWLTVVHEWSHYRHWHDWTARRDAHQQTSHEPYRLERWHGPVFVRMVDEAVEYLRPWLLQRGVKLGNMEVTTTPTPEPYDAVIF